MHPENRQLVGGSTVAAEWDQQLHCSFLCAGRIVWLCLEAPFDAHGSPRWAVRWAPAPPLTMTAADFTTFEAGKRQAQAQILAHAGVTYPPPEQP